MNIIFLDLDDNELTALNIGNIMQGHTSQALHFKIKNNGTEDITGLNLTTQILADGLGLPVDTINASRISLDNIDFSNEVLLDLLIDAQEDVYLKYQPSTTGVLGNKYWALSTNVGGDNVSPFPEWSYKSSFKVRATNADTDYQIQIIIPYISGIMQSNYDDIRFSLTDGTVLYYTKLSYDALNGIFLVKIPTILSYPDELQIIVYSGNPTATDASDPTNTFTWFDNFDNLNNWIIKNGTPTLSDSKVTIPPQTEIQTDAQFYRPITIYTYSKISGLVTNDYYISPLMYGYDEDKSLSTGLITRNSSSFIRSSDGYEQIIELSQSIADNQYHLFKMEINGDYDAATFYKDGERLDMLYGSIFYLAYKLMFINDVTGNSGQNLEVDWIGTTKYVSDPPISTNLQAWDLNTINIKLTSTILKDSQLFNEIIEEETMPRLTMAIGEDVFD